MRYAFAYGADAVYAGQPRYSLCAQQRIQPRKSSARRPMKPTRWGKKFYVVVNITAQRQTENLYP